MTENVIERNGGSLGGRIRLARLEAGITVRQLADLLDVDPRTVARWQADANDPSIEMLGQIARVLDKTPAYFLDVTV